MSNDASVGTDSQNAPAKRPGTDRSTGDVVQVPRGSLALNPVSYVVLGLFVVVVYVALKSWQRYITEAPIDAAEAIALGFAGRLPDISSWFVVIGFVVMLVFAMQIPCFCRAGVEFPIGFSNRAFSIFVGSVILAWGLYLHAVYRDTGTFFYHRGENAYDDPRVELIQAVEGIINLGLLGMFMFWGVLGHILVSRLSPLSTEDRETPGAECAVAMARACIWPVILIGIGATTGAINYDGVAHPVWANVTALFMWLVFFGLLVRVVYRFHQVMVVEWKPPWVRGGTRHK